MKPYRVMALCLVLSASQSWAHRSGPDPGLTGAPGEGNCTACHVGTVNSGGGNVKVEILNGSAYKAGDKHTLRITITDATASRWGFQLSARLKGTANKAGEFALKDPVSTRMETSNGLEYVTHTEAGTKAGATGPVTYEVEWNAPPAGAGNVVFYVAGNAANRDGSITGDKIYTASAEICR